ncbi:conserved hypothetical protein [Trichinella spiralis]|uniref:hypothetical protein n=1 Tax=Trichinella spiralis TaxID=6334 RepID=UPI0001EFCF24|nr:conserved hypothetical protein [Trichinella spiralis]
MGNMHKVIIAIRRHFGDCSFLYKSTVVAARKRSTEISRTLQAQAVSPPIKNGTYIMHTEMLIDSGLQYNITDLYTAMMIYRSLQSSKLDSYSAQSKDIQHKQVSLFSEIPFQTLKSGFQLSFSKFQL